MFMSDNMLYPKSSPVFDWYALLVEDLAATRPQFLYANIFGDAAGLSFYTSANSYNGRYYPVQNASYSSALTATPLPPTWTMLIVGIGARRSFLPRNEEADIRRMT